MDPPADRSLIGYQVNREPDFAITAADGIAVSTNPVFDVEPRLSRADKLAATAIGPAGQASVADQLTDVGHRRRPQPGHRPLPFQ